MIKILHVVSSLGSGGVENMLYNYYERMDKEEIRFDFIVHGKDIGLLEQKFCELGSNIYHVTPKKENFLRNFFEINSIISKNNYDIVHCHQNYSSIIPLCIAKYNKVKSRIVHSHATFDSKERKNKKIHLVIQKAIVALATHYCACTQDAAEYLFGKDIKNIKVKIIRNAIDINKYTFDFKDRETLKKEFNFNNKIVIGTIGRLSFEKNHQFLIEVYKSVKEKLPESILMIVGNGPLKQELQEKVCQLNLTNDIIFIDERLDVNKLYSTMDLFILPSLHEGLGMVLIEAQVNGLKCIASDEVIPRDTQLTNLIQYIKLSNLSKWEEEIITYFKKYDLESRFSKFEVKIFEDYDINLQVHYLNDYYMNIYNESKKAV